MTAKPFFIDCTCAALPAATEIGRSVTPGSPHLPPPPSASWQLLDLERAFMVEGLLPGQRTVYAHTHTHGDSQNRQGDERRPVWDSGVRLKERRWVKGQRGLEHQQRGSQVVLNAANCGEERAALVCEKLRRWTCEAANANMLNTEVRVATVWDFHCRIRKYRFKNDFFGVVTQNVTSCTFWPMWQNET